MIFFQAFVFNHLYIHPQIMFFLFLLYNFEGGMDLGIFT